MTDLLSVDEARRRIVAMARQRPPGPVALIEAAGLVLATDEVARRDLPGFDNSAMDGFAVRAADLAGASDAAPARLRLAGEVAAGSVFAGEVEPGTAVRIMTGAPLPTGADAVIEVELTSPGAAPGGEGRDAAKDGSRLGAEVLAHARIDPGRNVRRAGSDIRAGDLALRAGTHLGPYQIALLAALGAAWPVCIPRPTIALLATGDELVDVADEPGPGQVVNIVGPGLGAAAAMAGAIPFRLGPARDTMDELRRSLAGAATADVVVSVGGVSMGEYDLVRRAVEEIGELDFWRVAMRPGKPLAVGGLGGKPFIGLPGNPVSALVGFEVFVLPLILALSGRPGWRRPTVRAELAAPVASPAGLRNFVRASVVARPGQAPLAHPAAGQGSHQLRALAGSNALLDIPEEAADLPAGNLVEALLVDLPPAPA